MNTVAVLRTNSHHPQLGFWLVALYYTKLCENCGSK